VRQRVEMAARRPAQQRDEGRLAQPGHLAHRVDPPVAQLGRRDRADPPQPLDRQRMQELQFPLDRDDQQAIRLGDPARHLRQELGARHPDGDRQTDPLPDPLAKVGRDPGRRPRDPP